MAPRFWSYIIWLLVTTPFAAFVGYYLAYKPLLNWLARYRVKPTFVNRFMIAFRAFQIAVLATYPLWPLLIPHR